MKPKSIDVELTVQKIPTLGPADNPQKTDKSSFQHQFSANILCDLIGPFVLEQSLTDIKYLNFLSNKLPLIMRMYHRTHGLVCSFSPFTLLLSSYGDSVCCSCWSNALAAQISGAHPV
jgi:hypothetical protein